MTAAQTVAAWPDTVPEPAKPTLVPSFDLDAFIERYNDRLTVLRRKVKDDGTEVRELAACPFDPNHTGGSAAILRIGTGAIAFKCHHASCAGRTWSDLRAALDPEYRERGTGGVQPVCGPTARPGPTSPGLPTLVSADELFASDCAPVQPLIDGLLYEGLTLFVARAKTGKSWFTLQLALAISGGLDLRGVSALETGAVLYGAFEEPKARTAARIRKFVRPGPWSARLRFFYELLPLMGGGAEQLSALIEQVRPRLVVLDTLTALVKGGGKREHDAFRSQYSEVSCIAKLAERHKCAIVLVHHTRKGAADGVVESVAGTGGIAAAVDTLWQLKRKPEGEGVLEVLGREVEERTLAVRFGQSPFGWEVLGDDPVRALNGERREILELLREHGALTPAQIATELGKARPAVRQLLKSMSGDGQVYKQRGRYVSSLSVDHGITDRESE